MAFSPSRLISPVGDHIVAVTPDRTLVGVECFGGRGDLGRSWQPTPIACVDVLIKLERLNS